MGYKTEAYKNASKQPSFMGYDIKKILTGLEHNDIPSKAVIEEIKKDIVTLEEREITEEHLLKLRDLKFIIYKISEKKLLVYKLMDMTKRAIADTKDVEQRQRYIELLNSCLKDLLK